MPRARKTIIWLPRILSLAFVLFLSIFAFDVFEEFSGWRLVLALFMHLLPSLVFLTITVIAWRRQLVGAAAYFVLTALYTILIFGSGRQWNWWYALVCGPAVTVAILYFLCWRREKLLGKY